MDKQSLFQEGCELVRRFCRENDIDAPSITDIPCLGNYGVYSTWTNIISVDVRRCRMPSDSGWSWSWPRYKADLTPLGVVCHEGGHHVDFCRKRSSLRKDMRHAATIEKALTSYEPNLSEVIAESMKVFISNPTLLEELRPARYAALRSHLKPIETRHWIELIESDRHIDAILRQVG